MSKRKNDPKYIKFKNQKVSIKYYCDTLDKKISFTPHSWDYSASISEIYGTSISITIKCKCGDTHELELT